MSTEGKKLLAAVLANRVPRRMAEVAMSFAKIDLERRAAGLTKVERVDLVKNLLSMQVGVRGTLGFGRAEVTAGGVALNEIDSRSMQSKFVGGLFVAGELLDLDGPIGGYNFQAAWSTGWLAGIKAAAQAFSMGDRVAERL
jgi:predicted flavoprotein YhiN